MKKIIEKITFGKFLIAYSVVWVIAIVIIGIKLWGICSAYQTDYDASKAAANPDLVMDQELAIYNSDNLKNLAPDFVAMVSEFEKEDNIAAALDTRIVGKSITYERDENFAERKPRYNIKADGTLIGQVVLTQKAESDTFGFHICELSEASLLTDDIEFRSVNIVAPMGADVYVNGKLLDSSYVIEEKEFSSLVAKKAIEKSGVTHGTVTYEINNLLQEPTVELKIDGESYDFDEASEGSYVLQAYASDELVERVTNGVLEGGRLYIKNLNNLVGFGYISPYLVYGSDAYNNISSAQQGISWAGAPSELEIVEAEIVEIQVYSDSIFTAKTHYNVHRVYRGETYDEDMDFELLYENVNDHWYISSFALAK